MTVRRAISFVRSLSIPLVCVATPTAQIVSQVSKPSLETHIQEVTGRESVVNCGEYELGGVPQNAKNLLNSLACARDAAGQDKPFRIVVHGMSEDSSVAEGILSKVGARDGGVFWFNYDSAPCGGPLCAERFETTRWPLTDIVVFLPAEGKYQLGRLKR
jgi:hypothetical protein